MQDVFGTSCEPPRSPWARRDASGKGPSNIPANSRTRLWRRLPAYILPSLGATFLAAFILHLFVELATRLDPADPGGMVSIVFGMAAVLVTLLPFALVLTARARIAWRRSGEAGAFASGRR